MAFVTIDYREPRPRTYKGVVLKCGGLQAEPERFDTKDPVLDYHTALTVATLRAGAVRIEVLRSDSLDQWRMDGGIDIFDPSPEQRREAMVRARAYLVERGEL